MALRGAFHDAPAPTSEQRKFIDSQLKIVLYGTEYEREDSAAALRTFVHADGDSRSAKLKSTFRFDAQELIFTSSDTSRASKHRLEYVARELMALVGCSSCQSRTAATTLNDLGSSAEHASARRQAARAVCCAWSTFVNEMQIDELKEKLGWLGENRSGSREALASRLKRACSLTPPGSSFRGGGDRGYNMKF